MDIKSILLEDMKASMKDKNEIMKNTVMMVRAAIKQYEVDNRKDVDDNIAIEIIAKEVKKRNEAIVEYEKVNNIETVNNLKKEIEYLLKYLPEQLTENEIRQIVKDVVDETDAKDIKDMGKVMGVLKAKTVGKADSKLVSDIVREFLNK